MSSAKTTGLGRGFDSLLPTNFDQSILEDTERIINVLISDVHPNPDQPRKHFEDEAINQLADSIKQHGIIQPLVVSPDSSGYIIIAGERRWRAAQAAGLNNVPVLVKTVKELEQLEIALVENVQRVDLSPLEQAVSIQRLHDQFNMDYEQIAKRLGKAVPTVSNIVRLLQLPPDAAEALHEHKISEGHARAILALKDKPEKQQELQVLIISRQWSVRQAEQFVNASKEGKPKKAATARTEEKSAATTKISGTLDTKVTIKHMARGGRLMIHFRSEEDLERLIKLLSSISKN